MKKITLLFLTILSFQLNAQVQTWSQVSSLPASASVRNHPITFSIDGFGYTLTGFTGQALLNDFYRYDPTNDSWSTLTNFPGGARGFSYGTEYKGKGYIGFGIGVNASGVFYYDDLWEYDPATDTWKELASCPGDPRRHPAFLVANDKLYLGCGNNANGQDLRDWWEYDFDTDTWSQKTSLTAAGRHHPYFFTLNDEAYVGFGHSGQNIYKDLYRYNASTDSWTRMADLPAQGRVAGTQFSFNNKGYLLSGQGEDHGNMATGEFWEYDPITNSWAALTAHPGTSRWAPGCFVINNVVYFISGESGIGSANLVNTKDMWKYEFPPFPVVVNDIVKNDIAALYPNPTNETLTIAANSNIESVEIYNLLGVKINAPMQPASPKQIVVDCSALSQGNYFVRLRTSAGASSQQFAVKH